MENKQCNKCKRAFPEYLIDDYPRVLPKGICPICGKLLSHKINKIPLLEPFADPEQELMYKEAIEFTQQAVFPRGGHMINPPEECPYAARGWVDLAFCVSRCQGLCDRYREFRSMSPDDRRQELLDNNVLIP